MDNFNNLKTFEQFFKQQEVTVIIKSDEDYKDIIQNVKKYGAVYIPNSYQKQNHLISIIFKIDEKLLPDLISYLNDIGVEDIITE